MAILYVFLMMVITAILEGKYVTIPHELRHDFFPAVQASWKASLMGLAPMQLLSFHFLPMELRVLAVNVQDVVWVTVMSYVTHRNRH
jgi:protein Mpv17